MNWRLSTVRSSFRTTIAMCLHVVVERVAERDHLDERRKEHEEERHRIAQDGDEFLEEDGVEAAEGARFIGAQRESRRRMNVEFTRIAN